MPDLVVAAELRVLVAERVERVRVGRHDPPEAGLRQLADVVLDEHLEQPLLAGPPDVVAGVALAFVEDPEVDVGRLEDAGHEARRLLDADVERGEVADEPQPVDLLRAGVADRRRRARRVHFARARPDWPNELPCLARLVKAVWSPGSTSPWSTSERRIPTMVGTCSIADRAGLDAGEAGRARPERLGPDQAAGDQAARGDRARAEG